MPSNLYSVSVLSILMYSPFAPGKNLIDEPFAPLLVNTLTPLRLSAVIFEPVTVTVTLIKLASVVSASKTVNAD